jgi:hypothetical protein
MSRKVVTCSLALATAAALLALASCRSLQTLPDPAPGDGPDVTPTRIDYVDSDGFDALLEAALVNQDPVIVVRTGRSQPDWTGRLNAWIAAWNRGGRRTARGQAPLGKVPLDGESIRELRLLVGGLLDRIEELAQSGAAWWAEERARKRRVALLEPYSLRFHLDEDDLIQLVFFHGSYASYYPRFVRLWTGNSAGGQGEWSRCVECSHCRKKGQGGIDHLTSRAGRD